MIQRIQTLYLIIAAIISVVAIVLFFQWHGCSIEGASFICPMLLATIISIVSIFMFSNRSKQMKYVKRGNIFYMLSLIFPLVCLFRNDAETSQLNYLITISFPIISIFLCHMAWKAIKKDEMKVKAADRIR